jgi:hypothetical protein
MLCEYSLFNTIIYILIQVIFIFGFLCIFYFLYVIKFENIEFKKQLNLIVDDIVDIIKDNVKNIHIDKKQEVNIDPDKLKIIINGLIDTTEEKITSENQDNIKIINTKNNNLKHNVFLLIGIIFVSLLVLLIIYRCKNFLDSTKEGILVVFFVGITELIFLLFISGKYIAASPQKVKDQMCQAIIDYIKENQLLKN